MRMPLRISSWKSHADAGFLAYTDSINYSFPKGSGYSGWRIVDTLYRAGCTCISGRAANVSLLEKIKDVNRTSAHSRPSVQEDLGSGGK